MSYRDSAGFGGLKETGSPSKFERMSVYTEIRMFPTSIIADFPISSSSVMLPGSMPRSTELMLRALCLGNCRIVSPDIPSVMSNITVNPLDTPLSASILRNSTRDTISTSGASISMGPPII
ncbi:120aa long hypothetical protein [Pyrococcus horikoshii OT3]|uniref:Uncharacterized protein n=1 Tax=Pyrococcus horikoshii (strain ATCC 700860 / DSM 12428 / JCM 9974 / NBRC 100139 / OT-3) TaxID=70601 RepID=O58225_PYRHO|nr:120aa long hypothetical protein [Pyrococcus horikoshii OT3]